MIEPTRSADDDEAAQSDRDAAPPAPTPLATVVGLVRTAALSVLILTFLTGVLFPLALAALACPLFPHRAGGSLLIRDHEVIGSELIGQEFTGPGYFHPRPSAAGRGYDAAASGGTNLAPTNPKLRDGARDDPSTPGADESFTGIRELTGEYRSRNGVPPDAIVPADAVTRSGSGLDPHISPANAALQVPRVARARRLSEEAVGRLVADHTLGRQFGILGEPRVAVLPLNLALDRTAGPNASAPAPAP
jgi:K+-transporting ATPase ATPase C chain